MFASAAFHGARYKKRAQAPPGASKQHHRRRHSKESTSHISTTSFSSSNSTSSLLPPAFAANSSSGTASPTGLRRASATVSMGSKKLPTESQELQQQQRPAATQQQSPQHHVATKTKRRGSLLKVLPLPSLMAATPSSIGCATCHHHHSPHISHHHSSLGGRRLTCGGGDDISNHDDQQGFAAATAAKLAMGGSGGGVDMIRGMGPPLRKRSGSAPLLQYTLAYAWNLKPSHVRALKVTWARLCDTPRFNCRGILAIMERVFEKFESKEKTLKDIFYRSAFVDSMVDCSESLRFATSTHHAAAMDNAAAGAKGGNHREQRRSSAETTTTANNSISSHSPSRACSSPTPVSIATLHDHIHFFVSLISQVVNSLERNPGEMFEHIDKIGCYHAHLRPYGFRASMWDRLGVCLLDGLVVQDCLRGYPDACRAWTMMVAALIDRLRSAPTHTTRFAKRDYSRASNNTTKLTTDSSASSVTSPTSVLAKLSMLDARVASPMGQRGSFDKQLLPPSSHPTMRRPYYTDSCEELDSSSFREDPFEQEAREFDGRKKCRQRSQSQIPYIGY